MKTLKIGNKELSQNKELNLSVQIVSFLSLYRRLTNLDKIVVSKFHFKVHLFYLHINAITVYHYFSQENLEKYTN